MVWPSASAGDGSASAMPLILSGLRQPRIAAQKTASAARLPPSIRS